MNREDRIRAILNESFTPDHLEIINESHQHSGPGSDTHFKLIVVAQSFQGLSRVARHRHINDLLKNELQSGLHALTLHLFSQEEWKAKSDTDFTSPACLGGSKREQK